MVVLVVERVTPSLRGKLTRWMLEVRAGVYVGTLSAAVRDRLWDLVVRGLRGGAGVMACSDNSEQGFRLLVAGDPRRQVVDFDGLQLVKQPRIA